jgi:predicted Zn-dependent peptidase
VKIHAKDTDQTHLTLAFRAYHASHEDLPTLQVLNILLGGNMSSRLFINIREREGLCYYINSHIEAHSDCGYFAVKAGVDNKRAVRAIELIMKELHTLREEKVKSAELRKAQEYVRGKLALALETSNEVAFWVGGQEMTTGKIKTPREIMKEVEGVTASSLQRVASEIIVGSGLNLVAISPRRQKTFEKALLA